MIIKEIAILFYFPSKATDAVRQRTSESVSTPPPDTGRGKDPQDASSASAGQSRLWEGPEWSKSKTCRTESLRSPLSEQL